MGIDTSRVHNSWAQFMTPEIQSELKYIAIQIGDDFTPSEDKVLRFMSTDLNTRKVVILGQDPYKPAGVANGRSFQPMDLTSWTQPFRQISLKNILRAIYTAHYSIEEYRKIPGYSEIAGKIGSGKFDIKQPYEWFDSLENQGVLLLNTTLTCRTGESNSHKEIWGSFKVRLLKYISEQRPDLVWFMWGKDAIDCKQYIKTGKFYESRHPMMCSEKYEDDFLKSKCFKETTTIINWLG